MRDPVVKYDLTRRGQRRYLLGLTDIGDWKMLAVFDSEADIRSWLTRLPARYIAPFSDWLKTLEAIS